MDTTPTLTWPAPTRGDWRDGVYLCRSCGAHIDTLIIGGVPLCDPCWLRCVEAAESWGDWRTPGYAERVRDAVRRAVGAT